MVTYIYDEIDIGVVTKVRNNYIFYDHALL